MIEINLLPSEYRPKVSSKFVMPEIPIKKTLFTVSLALLVLQLVATAFAAYQVFELGGIRARIARLGSEGERITKEKEVINAISDRLSQTVSMAQRKFYWASLLSGLSNSATKGIWLTEIYAADRKPGDKTPAGSDEKKPVLAAKILRIRGSVVGPGEETAALGRFLKELKANAIFSELFSSIELSDMVQKKVRDFDVYDFSIFCAFKPDKLDKSVKSEKGSSV